MANKRTPEKSARQRRLDKLGKGPSLDGGSDEPSVGLFGLLADRGCGLLGCGAFGVLAVALLAAALVVAFIHGCK